MVGNMGKRYRFKKNVRFGIFPEKRGKLAAAGDFCKMKEIFVTETSFDFFCII